MGHVEDVTAEDTRVEGGSANGSAQEGLANAFCLANRIPSIALCALSSADEQRAGFVEVADGKTLVLKEIGEFSKALQSWLLCALESGEIRGVGDNPLHGGCFLGATHRSLDEMVTGVFPRSCCSASTPWRWRSHPCASGWMISRRGWGDAGQRLIAHFHGGRRNWGCRPRGTRPPGILPPSMGRPSSASGADGPAAETAGTGDSVRGLPSGAGWDSDLPAFQAAEPKVVCLRLVDFVPDADQKQQDAWRHWIPQLQRQSSGLLAVDPLAITYSAILEYRLPRDLRRPDVIVLEQGVVVVLELKGPDTSERAGLDQVLAYARDLRAYHEECHNRPVVPVLVRPQFGGAASPAEGRSVDGAWVVSPQGIATLLGRLVTTLKAEPLSLQNFLRDDAYCPLPSIVDAARELFEHGELPYIKRAQAHTEPALEAITAIAKEAKATQTRHLVVLTGVPGSGKTLVGLQIVHAKWLDRLASPDGSARPKSPAVYLSGNGPLVQVLQHALSSAGGGGQTFVQDVKKYVEYHSKKGRVPLEHVVVFDEAQRAHDPDQFAKVHKLPQADLSEPAHLMHFMQRVPEWCVLVALVGSGQAIHNGEEVGLPLWREAILRDQAAGSGTQWIVHAPETIRDVFDDVEIVLRENNTLNLDHEIRHHMVPRVHEYVEHILGERVGDTRELAEHLFQSNHRFLVTRDLDEAKRYVRDRYGEAPLARYGLIASSRCKTLPSLGIDNTFSTLRRFRAGPWFNNPKDDPLSCRRLDMVGTEFKVQGLELDMAILAWGTDFRRVGGVWSDSMATKHQKKVLDSLRLRLNAYRVLLTRGRDGTVIFVPPVPELDETHEWIVGAGAASFACGRWLPSQSPSV